MLSSTLMKYADGLITLKLVSVSVGTVGRCEKQGGVCVHQGGGWVEGFVHT